MADPIGDPTDEVLYFFERDIFLNYTDPFERLAVAPPIVVEPKEPSDAE